MTTDQAPTEPTAPPPPAAPAPQPSPQPIAPDVQALIEAAKMSAYNAGAKDTRVAYEAKIRSMSSAPPAAATPTAPVAPTDVGVILKLRDDFDDATAALALPVAQKKFLREQVMSQRPPDVEAFVRSFVDVWGQPAATAAPPATTTTTPGTPAPLAQPVVSRPAAPPPQAVTDDAPILSMTPDQRIALARRIGDKAFADRLMSEAPHTRIA